MNKLRYLRKKKNISLRDLSDATNISYPTLSRLENDSSSFNEDNLTILSDYFNVSIDFLLGRTENPKGSSFDSNNSSEPDIDDFAFALYDETKELTDEQKQDIMDMVKKMKEIMRK